MALVPRTGCCSHWTCVTSIPGMKFCKQSFIGSKYLLFPSPYSNLCSMVHVHVSINFLTNNRFISSSNEAHLV